MESQGQEYLTVLMHEMKGTKTPRDRGYSARALVCHLKERSDFKDPAHETRGHLFHSLLGERDSARDKPSICLTASFFVGQTHTRIFRKRQQG